MSSSRFWITSDQPPLLAALHWLFFRGCLWFGSLCFRAREKGRVWVLVSQVFMRHLLFPGVSRQSVCHSCLIWNFKPRAVSGTPVGYVFSVHGLFLPPNAYAFFVPNCCLEKCACHKTGWVALTYFSSQQNAITCALWLQFVLTSPVINLLLSFCLEIWELHLQESVWAFFSWARCSDSWTVLILYLFELSICCGPWKRCFKLKVM